MHVPDVGYTGLLSDGERPEAMPAGVEVIRVREVVQESQPSRRWWIQHLPRRAPLISGPYTDGEQVVESQPSPAPAAQGEAPTVPPVEEDMWCPNCEYLMEAQPPAASQGMREAVAILEEAKAKGEPTDDECRMLVSRLYNVLSGAALSRSQEAPYYPQGMIREYDREGKLIRNANPEYYKIDAAWAALRRLRSLPPSEGAQIVEIRPKDAPDAPPILMRIDPGQSAPEDIAELFSALNTLAMHQGVSRLEFTIRGMQGAGPT